MPRLQEVCALFGYLDREYLKGELLLQLTQQLQSAASSDQLDLCDGRQSASAASSDCLALKRCAASSSSSTDVIDECAEDSDGAKRARKATSTSISPGDSGPDSGAT
eukprot:CAMPEP_0119315802 /NCGR_PEP_ID=MMETSP1333-20130426/37241_1 /TAXON_ID=418940 /ORGANISM="Scyphosphaera apsteinii, Strain RCC1455" /LENGTH=106 /DNA_ID=CAMNT_0007321269 /DNA_START=302 /DNA_END=622 /DNA_ORIENTATION=-